MNNLAKRTLTAVILAPIIIWITLKGEITFNILVVLIFTLAAYEWNNITKKAKNKITWKIIGLFYILIPALYLLFLGNQGIEFRTQILIILLVVWFTDIGGYVFGRLIGGPKLAPRISPSKTWAGFFGGLLLPLIVLIPFYHFPPSITFFTTIGAVVIVLSTISQIGDLFESWVKRKFKVKDSGNIIPGHGGVLDRIDGLIFVLMIIPLYKITASMILSL